MLALSLLSSFSPCFSKPDCQFGYGPLWEWRGCQMFILESNNSQMSIYSPISGQSRCIKEKSSNKQWFATIWFLPWVFNTPSLLWQSVLSQRGLITLLALFPVFLSQLLILFVKALTAASCVNQNQNPRNPHRPLPLLHSSSNQSLGPVDFIFSIHLLLFSLLLAKPLSSLSQPIISNLSCTVWPSLWSRDLMMSACSSPSGSPRGSQHQGAMSLWSWPSPAVPSASLLSPLPAPLSCSPVTVSVPLSYL